MIYIYICVTVLVMLIAGRCLRNKYDSLYPVALMSSIVAAFVILIVQQLYFNFDSKNTVYKTEKFTYDITVVKKGKGFCYSDGDYYTFSDPSEHYRFYATNAKKSYRVRTEYNHDNSVSSSGTLISTNVLDSAVVEFYLTKKDYELYQSYKNNGK